MMKSDKSMSVRPFRLTSFCIQSPKNNNNTKEYFRYLLFKIYTLRYLLFNRIKIIKKNFNIIIY